jgi:hypothetical protein
MLLHALNSIGNSSYAGKKISVQGINTEIINYNKDYLIYSCRKTTFTSIQINDLELTPFIFFSHFVD